MLPCTFNLHCVSIWVGSLLRVTASIRKDVAICVGIIVYTKEQTSKSVTEELCRVVTLNLPTHFMREGACDCVGFLRSIIERVFGCLLPHAKDSYQLRSVYLL